MENDVADLYMYTCICMGFVNAITLCNLIFHSHGDVLLYAVTLYNMVQYRVLHSHWDTTLCVHVDDKGSTHKAPPGVVFIHCIFGK